MASKKVQKKKLGNKSAKKSVKAAKKISVKKPVVKKAAKKIVTKAVKKVSVKKAPVKKAAKVKIIEKKVVQFVPEKPAVKAPVVNSHGGHHPIAKEIYISKSKPGDFAKGVKVVYPAHGVGEIIGIETHMIAGTELKQYVIQFEREKMVLRVPVARAERSGLRTLSTNDELNNVKKTLLERPKSSRGMWSRRAKEYESKINSGNIVSVAEVVRDLHKNVDDPERSYSERVIYENALERLAREVSAIKKLDIADASGYLVQTINDNNPYFIKKAQAKKAAQEAEEAEEMAA